MHARNTFIAATAALALCGSAQALTVSFSGSTGVISSAGSLSLQQFDPALGTLTGIDIALDSGFNGTFRVVQDTAPGTASGAKGFITGSILNIAGPTQLGALVASAGSAFSVAVPPTYNQFFSGGQVGSASYGPLASFVGQGTVAYGFFGSSTDTTTASNGLLRGIVNALFLVNADVTYTYTGHTPPVPEASTLAMLLAGLGAIGFIGRRRRA